jgi:hypothetical protein
MVVVPTLAAQSAPPVRGYLNDSSLALLRPLIGRWRPLVVYNAAALPPGAMIVAEDFRWTFGGKSIHYRENYVAPNADSALVEGTIYWNPATERVEFRAVSAAGAGHLYVGEYRALADGRLEREFTGYYQSAADVPPDALGGTRRRDPQRVELLAADTLGDTHEWFHNRAWRPFGVQLANNTHHRKRP